MQIFQVLGKTSQFLFSHFTKNWWIVIFNFTFSKTISWFLFFISTFHKFSGHFFAFFNFVFFSFPIFSSLKANFIFTEMFKQQNKILIETRFCFYIHNPKNGELIVRNYKKTTNKFAQWSKWSVSDYWCIAWNDGKKTYKTRRKRKTVRI